MASLDDQSFITRLAESQEGDEEADTKRASEFHKRFAPSYNRAASRGFDVRLGLSTSVLIQSFVNDETLYS